MPSFFKQILLFFRDLKILFEQDAGQDMILFNNKEILIDGQTVSYNDWLKGQFTIFFTKIADNFSQHQFKLNYNLNCNFF